MNVEDVLENDCTIAMVVGMSYHEYWYGDPDAFAAYARLYRKRSKEEFMERDTMAWLIGSYVDAAVGHVISSAFGESGKPKASYPEQPVYLVEVDEAAKKRKLEHEVRKQEANLLTALHNMGKTVKEAAAV